MTPTVPTTRWRTIASANSQTVASETATSVSVAADFSFDASAAPVLTVVSEHVGSVTAWLWDFGDTNTATTQNATHTYLDRPGESTDYTVKLTVNAGPNKSKTVTISPAVLAAGAVDLSAKTLTIASATAMGISEVDRMLL